MNINLYKLLVFEARRDYTGSSNQEKAIFNLCRFFYSLNKELNNELFAEKHYKKGELDEIAILRNEYIKFLNLLSIMSEESRLIIEYDYYYAKDNKWFYDFFSKSTYYKRKQTAIKEFVELLKLL
ncbi:MG284/MPN403 family protein [Mycoplasmopsis opalescens]|uniref:MG284/MPN403 family protein n=1 Tax=Mycoplasmopsis opalescens TaxID=114886 RepID=UPI000690F97C|nr:hypothetical protein [Mycoplasmopsis opalescens]